MEKAFLSMVLSMQKIKHYMLSHPVKLIAKIDPLKYRLYRTTLTGCMAKWVMLLSEFDIEYMDQKFIKGQVIADQLADAPLVDAYPLVTKFLDEEVFTIAEEPTWILYINGSYTHNGLGVGIFFITSQGNYIPKSFKLAFLCTNNIAEYEALLIGLRIAKQWHITHLRIFDDSLWAIKQVNDEFLTKDDKLLP